MLIIKILICWKINERNVIVTYDHHPSENESGVTEIGIC